MAEPAMRSADDLAAQIKIIERWLRFQALSPEEAAAYASRGARLESDQRLPKGYGQPENEYSRPVRPARPECTKERCLCPNHASPRFEADVDRMIDSARIPLHLWTRGTYCFSRYLSSMEQWTLELVCRRGMNYRDAALWAGLPGGRTIGVGYRQIGNVKGQALEKLARLLWDDSGAPIWG